MNKCKGINCKLKNSCYFFVGKLNDNKGSFEAPFIILENEKHKCDKFISLNKGITENMKHFSRYGGSKNK